MPAVSTSIKQNPETCKREIAYIPDNPDIYDFMTGTKYLNFIADIFGVGIAERNERIKKYADIVEKHLHPEDCTMESLMRDNAFVLSMCKKYDVEYLLIDEEYDIDINPFEKTGN